MALLNSVAPEGIFPPDISTQNAVIAAHSDAFRRALGFAAQFDGQPLKGQVLRSIGFTALPEITQAALMRETITFSAFDAENDPWGDHSFGVVDAHGVRAIWKIDVYDEDYSFGVARLDATDPQKVRRVLTLYLPSEH